MAKVIPPDEFQAAQHSADVPPPAPPLITGDQVMAGAPIVQLTFEQLRELIASATRAAGSGGGSQELQLAAAALQQLGDEVKRTVRRSNATHPKISAFSYPDGEEARPKPTLRYETYFCSVKQREDQLTPTEIELFNKFETSMFAGDGRYKAVLEKSGTTTRLHVTAPARSLDDLASIPPLTQLLGELLYGSEVADPSLSMQRLLDAEKKIAELTASLAALSAPPLVGASA